MFQRFHFLRNLFEHSRWWKDFFFAFIRIVLKVSSMGFSAFTIHSSLIHRAEKSISLIKGRVASLFFSLGNVFFEDFSESAIEWFIQKSVLPFTRQPDQIPPKGTNKKVSDAVHYDWIISRKANHLGDYQIKPSRQEISLGKAINLRCSCSWTAKLHLLPGFHVHRPGRKFSIAVEDF